MCVFPVFLVLYDRTEVIICIITWFLPCVSLQSDKSSERVQAESQTGKSYILTLSFQIHSRGFFSSLVDLSWGRLLRRRQRGKLFSVYL